MFDVIIEANLKLKSSKCSLGTNTVKFLRHEISVKGLRPDAEKVGVIQELPPPIDALGVKRILGAFGYYRKFIPN